MKIAIVHNDIDAMYSSPPVQIPGPYITWIFLSLCASVSDLSPSLRKHFINCPSILMSSLSP